MKMNYPRLLFVVFSIALLMCSPFAFSADEGQDTAPESASEHHGVGGEKLPLWSVIPFIGILLSIAIFPLAAPHFWHHHFGKVSLAWSLIFAVPYIAVFHGPAFYDILHIYLIDYIPFIILLWGLYTVAGGILVRGSLRGTPMTNLIMLVIGTAIASWRRPAAVQPWAKTLPCRRTMPRFG